MPHVTQPHSALARVEAYILAAQAALEAGRLEEATRSVGLALGAVTFAANSQTKLITTLTCILDDKDSHIHPINERAGREAVVHAEGPGID